jgi:dihydropteroate synthase
MGIVNVTPDSFSDGGLYLDPRHAVDHALRLVAEGADIVDLGAESTRPGSAPVSAEEEMRRLLPVVEALRPQTDCLISIDTSKCAVAAGLLALGADIVNDVTALQGDSGMAPLVAQTGAGIVLMHMRGAPATMQDNPVYGDAVEEIAAFLRARMEAARAAGIADEQIVLDPGIGFGKTVEHNLRILACSGAFAVCGRPVLVGPSRKSFIGKTLNTEVVERLEGTAAAVACAVMQGASILRVHDVRFMRRTADMAAAIRDAKSH